jgi:uncharacterized secreted repeat protein (TIGR03808 family)
MLDRRRLLKATAGFAVLGLALPGGAAAAGLHGIQLAAMRGSINAGEFGVSPDALDDQSRAFSAMLQAAAEQQMQIFLPPGAYHISNIALPEYVRLAGVPGATRLIYRGNGHMLLAEEAEHIELTGLAVDGANRWLGDHAQAIVEARRVRHFVIDNCAILGSGKHAVALERVSGRIERSTISGAADAGIYSVEGGGLQVTGNTVSDCGNGGILIHRWQADEDGTMVTGNRVEHILATKGGTGQNGNGINIFRADNVIVANNIIADCAFSAIRANSASNIQITGNNCARSGETAIYSEFAFEGAVINSNIIDGAANGISIVNFDQGGRMSVCSGNLVRNLSAEGPYQPDPPGFGTGIAVEADCSVTGNLVENAPLYGIGVGWGPFMRNVVATGNVVREAGRGIAVSVVEGTGSAVVSDNVIDGAKAGAVVGHRWGEVVTADLALAAASGYPHLTVERNQVS